MKTILKYNIAITVMICIAIGLSRCTSPGAPKETTGAATIDTTNTDTTAIAVEGTDTMTKVAARAPLTLIITNLKSATAPVIVGLYGTNNKFPDPKDQLKEYKFTPHGMKLIARIKNLAFGAYAIAMYQDVNSNGKIDKNFIGIPTEPYAFSNNYKPTVKAPAFKNCQFDYDSTTNTVAMTMIN